MGAILRQIRSLFRQPALVIGAVIVLALGMGINTAMFAVLDHVLLHPLPFPDSSRLITIYASSPLQGLNKGVASVADFLDLKSQTTSFSDLAGYSIFPCNLPATKLADTSEQVRCAYTTANFFTALRQPALLGRPFVHGDDDPGHPEVAVMGETLWKQRYGSDPSIVGQMLDLDGKPFQIVGIMPANFRFPKDDVVLWVIIPLTPPQDRDPFFLRIIGRLRDGVSMEQARSELGIFAANLELKYPRWYSHLSFPLLSLQEAVIGDVRTTLLVLQGLVLLVLLIALINIAGLLLVRAFKREREVAIQICLGARPLHLMQQAVIDSTVLSILGGGLGLAIAAVCLFYLRRFGPQNIPGLQRVALNGSAVMFTFAVSLITGVLIGVLPALQGLRSGLASLVRESGTLNSTMSRSRKFSREALLVGEMTVCFVLVVAAGMLLKTLFNMEKVDLGFLAPPDQLLSMQISPSGPFDAQRRILFYDQLLRAVRSLQGVKSAAVSASLPPDRTTFTMSFEVEGKPTPANQRNPSVTVPICSTEYFKTLGIPLLKGRLFTENDTLKTTKVAIISERFAKQFFAGQDPIGKRLRDDDDRPYAEIVGVVGDAKYTGVTSEYEPVYYYPSNQEVGQYWSYLILRADHPDALVNSIRQQLRAIDPAATVSHFTRMDQSLDDSLVQARIRAFLMTAFALLAVVLTMVGIYSLLSYHMRERRREIGISFALGASYQQILLGLLWRNVFLGSIAILCGVLVSFAVSRLLHVFLYGMKDNDMVMLTATSVVILAVVVTATYLATQAIRGLQPSDVLRPE